MTKSKTHPLLSEISTSFSGVQKEITVEFMGRSYVLRLGKPEAEEWIATQTTGTTLAAALANQRLPCVAASLASIDGHPVETLFQFPDDMETSTRELITRDGQALRTWRREAILTWLREEGNDVLVDALYDGYKNLLKERRSALSRIENLANGTPSQS